MVTFHFIYKDEKPETNIKLFFKNNLKGFLLKQNFKSYFEYGNKEARSAFWCINVYVQSQLITIIEFLIA